MGELSRLDRKLGLSNLAFSWEVGLNSLIFFGGGVRGWLLIMMIYPLNAKFAPPPKKRQICRPKEAFLGLNDLFHLFSHSILRPTSPKTEQNYLQNPPYHTAHCRHHYITFKRVQCAPNRRITFWSTATFCMRQNWAQSTTQFWHE